MVTKGLEPISGIATLSRNSNLESVDRCHSLLSYAGGLGSLLCTGNNNLTLNTSDTG